MKNYAQTIRRASLLLPCAAFLGALLAGGFGAGASAQEVSTSYRRARKDPFVKYQPKPVKPRVKVVPKPVAPPSVQERVATYKSLKAQAMSLQQPAPKPTTAFLIDEVQVTGIFRTPRGYAAMVEAAPIKLSYVVYPGEVFFNGRLVAIEENRLVFRRETKWTDGRREVNVDLRPLRQANAVEDSMAATKQANAEAPAAAGDKSKDDAGKRKEEDKNSAANAGGNLR